MRANVDSIAGRQHGLITRQQALDCRFSPRQIDRLLRTGQWIRVVKGIFRIAGAQRTWHQQLLAAVLVAGPDAVASHHSAARLWGLPGFRDAPIHVTQPRGRSRAARIGVRHETTTLVTSDIRRVDGIPVTGPERTLVDLFAVLHGRRAKRAQTATANMLRAGHTSLGRLAVAFTRSAGRGQRGTVALRAVLARHDDGEPITESELEELVMQVIRELGLPLPRRQVGVGGTSTPVGRVDFLFPPSLVLEANSRAHHGQWLDEEADAVRDMKLAAAGYDVLRATWRMMVDERELFGEGIRSKLDRLAA